MATTKRPQERARAQQSTATLWTVVEFPARPSRGKGGPPSCAPPLKNVLSGKVVDRHLQTRGRRSRPRNVDKRTMQYLYGRRRRLCVHGPVELRPNPGAICDGRRCREVHAVGGRGDRGHPRGGVPPLTSRWPTSVFLEGDLHRAGPAGRPLDRRHEAGHRRDGCADRGAAVHHHRREDQGRHARRPLPSAVS